MDYMYMNKNQIGEELFHPILVIKAKISGGVWALPVIRKGPYINNIVKRVVNIINSVGRPKIITDTDHELAMIALQHEIRKELWAEILDIASRVKDVREDGDEVMDYVPGGPGGVVILENSPVGESQSNGSVEIAIKEVQWQIRKLKDQLQQNVQADIQPESPIWPWLIQYLSLIHISEPTRPY